MHIVGCPGKLLLLFNGMTFIGVNTGYYLDITDRDGIVGGDILLRFLRQAFLLQSGII